jgi:hypothetical protein
MSPVAAASNSPPVDSSFAAAAAANVSLRASLATAEAARDAALARIQHAHLQLHYERSRHADEQMRLNEALKKETAAHAATTKALHQRTRVDEATIVALRTEVARLQSSLASTREAAAGEEHERLCVVCMDRRRDVLYLPCAHLVNCATCATTQQSAGMRNCSQCYKPIAKRITINISQG